MVPRRPKLMFVALLGLSPRPDHSGSVGVSEWWASGPHRPVSQTL